MPTKRLVERLRAPGFVGVCASAQNIDRVVSLYRACKQTGRTLVLDLYALEVLAATGNPHIPRADWPNIAVYVPEYQRRHIKRTERFDVVDRYKPNRIYRERLADLAPRAVMLFRPAMLPDIDLVPGAWNGARMIWSQWYGYLPSPANQAFLSRLAERGVPLEVIHTSGHASIADLRWRPTRWCRCTRSKVTGFPNSLEQMSPVGWTANGGRFDVTEFKKGLSQEFIDALGVLAKTNCWWRDVLLDPTLLIGIRNEALDVYWHGQALFYATYNGRVRVNTHVKYLLDPDRSDRILLNEDGSMASSAEPMIKRYEGTKTLEKMKRAANFLREKRRWASTQSRSRMRMSSMLKFNSMRKKSK